MSRQDQTSSPESQGQPSAVTEFLRSETTGGIVLAVAAATAILWANLGGSYFDFWQTELSISPGGIKTPGDLQHWVNDCLMTIFFFVVALEIKRELVTGELSDRRSATLPVLAAFGGVILPALIFIAIVGTGAEEAKAWAIPIATDIAFAVGILALLGDRVPLGARVLLLSFAIVDDVIAITVIAIFYTTDFSLLWLVLAAALALAMILANRLGVTAIPAYAALGLLVWFATLQSGIHATIAGVAIGLLTPARPVDGRKVLELLEHRLHPFAALLIVPLFALANAGIAFDGEVFRDAASSSLAAAIVAGLVFGKLFGISGAIFLAERLGIGRLPDGVRWAHVWGVAALGGIGFTVSLFITQLSFTDPDTISLAKIGIFAGSALSAALGVTLLLRSQRHRTPNRGPM